MFRSRSIRLGFSAKLCSASMLLGFLTGCVAIPRSYYIPSAGMAPTLQVNDRIVAQPSAYRTTSPQRGDIVLFKPTDRMIELYGGGLDPNTPFLQRVIGLPGETVEIKDGSVYINNQPLQESYIAEPAQYQWGPVTVPSGSYVVLGDNRNNSFDSHMWDFLPHDRLIGQVTWRYFPFDRYGEIE